MMHESIQVSGIRQMKTESGEEFYPPTLSGAIFGDINALGNTVNVVDISYCLGINFSGTFTVTIVNNRYYFYNIDAYYGRENTPIPTNTVLIVANNVPQAYRIVGSIMPLDIDDGITDYASVYIDGEGTIECTINSASQVTEDYVSSITSIKATGFFVREEETNNG